MTDTTTAPDAAARFVPLLSAPLAVPVVNPPPWMYTATGLRRPSGGGGGAHTLRLRQSSLMPTPGAAAWVCMH